MACSLALVFLSGCSSRIALPQQIEDRNYDNMYLRGVFNWWEADAAYKFTKSGPSQYSVKVQLIADGQPYDFKLADPDWTPGLTCGTDETSDVIEVSDRFRLDCGAEEIGNLRFTPSETGDFLFILDTSSASRPVLSVSRVSQD
ncbi:hypothetical protein [Aestuariibacter salexigens]|uniref:hypothetical protein n=1 Tax=Aestuariibacter salexigens TaxID=226010 RepID=UPI00040758E4|nr:hypothetical protein [Aestuariibacter salexigens]